MHAICTTRGVPFEPRSAAAQRERLKAEARKIREEEERAYREHLPQQIRAMRKRRA